MPQKQHAMASTTWTRRQQHVTDDNNAMTTVLSTKTTRTTIAITATVTVIRTLTATTTAKLSLFVTLCIFLHLTVMYSCTFGKRWVGRGCLYFWYEFPLVVFSLWELIYMHCVYLALWTRKGLCGSFFYALYRHFHSFTCRHTTCPQDSSGWR